MNPVRLRNTWVVMMVLTLATSAVLYLHLPLPRWLWVGALCLVAFAKGRLILLDYLELRRCGNWRGPFVAGLGLLLALVAGLAVAG